MTAKNGIKSKERVQQHGEVFTPDSIVNDMLDLVDNELYAAMDKEGLSEEDKARKYIENTVLEPSCGDGQFLIRILYRKLEAVKKLPVEERELAIVKAFCSIYGVDIQLDNVKESRSRMLDLLEGKEVDTFDNKEPRQLFIKVNDLGVNVANGSDLYKAAKFITKANIVLGNTLLTNGEKPYDKFEDDDKEAEKRPVYFNEWTFSGNKVNAKFKFLHADWPGNNSLPVEGDEVDFMNIGNVWKGHPNPIDGKMAGVKYVLPVKIEDSEPVDEEGNYSF